MKIYPAILEKNSDDFLTIIKKLLPFFSYFQIDIVDKNYANNQSLSLSELISIFKQNPWLKKVRFDLHLMTKDLNKNLLLAKDLSQLTNLNFIFIQADLLPKPQLFLKKQPFSLAISLKIKESVSWLTKNYSLSSLPAIQIMTVEIGQQGNPFIKNALDKINQLRSFGYQKKIFVDGGINNHSLGLIKKLKSQPDVLVVGSFLTKSPVNQLKKRVSLLTTEKIKTSKLVF